MVRGYFLDSAPLLDTIGMSGRRVQAFSGFLSPLSFGPSMQSHFLLVTIEIEVRQPFLPSKFALENAFSEANPNLWLCVHKKGFLQTVGSTHSSLEEVKPDVARTHAFPIQRIAIAIGCPLFLKEVRGRVMAGFIGGQPVLGPSRSDALSKAKQQRRFCW